MNANLEVKEIGHHVEEVWISCSELNNDQSV